jgi:abhydrolase domain-containing protein 5
VGHPPPPPTEADAQQVARQRSWLRRLVLNAWEKGVTPMTITRVAGPYGPQLVQNALQRRISFMPASSALRNGSLDVQLLGEYIYHNWALKASSERVMSTHLAPMAYARRPLIDVLVPDNMKMPVTFIYGGESDWMDYRQGLKVVEKLRSAGQHADLHLIPYSGHQVFLDNPTDFNKAVVASLVRD